LKLLDPVRRLAHAIVDKRNWLPILREYLDGKIRHWTRSPVRIDSIDSLVEALTSKALPTKVAVTKDEADYLLSSLHGQGTFSDRNDFEVSSISTARMTGGRSNSVVLKCQPRTSHQMSGIWTVVKISPRSEAAEEYLRYLRYVRFLVSLDARVELLGYVAGDTLGAICYSFAGRTPNVVQGLNDLFESSDDRAFIVLNRLFAPEAQCWYATSGKVVSISEFLNQAYSLKTEEVIKTVAETIHKAQAKLPGVELRDGGLIWNGIKLPDPTHTLGSPKMSRKYKSCIVHGDMNANNIITAEDGRAIMIDYRHTTVGPRALDFAALETAIRLVSISPNASAEEILKTFRHEVSAWKLNWGTTNRFPQDDRDVPYWQKVSSQLTALARMNFQDLTALEYACTCFGWIARMLRVRLPFEQRLRLICWMGQLSQVIEGKS
jgi:hypothetical protein